MRECPARDIQPDEAHQQHAHGAERQHEIKPRAPPDIPVGHGMVDEFTQSVPGETRAEILE
jgi:hypothetical protein